MQCILCRYDFCWICGNFCDSNHYKNPESKSRMEDEIQELSELTLGRILIIDDNRSIVSDSKGRNAESYF